MSDTINARGWKLKALLHNNGDTLEKWARRNDFSGAAASTVLNHGDKVIAAMDATIKGAKDAG